MDSFGRERRVGTHRTERRSSLRRTALAAAIAMLASATAPAPVPQSHGDKEAQAIAALQTIAAAQAQLKADVDIDTDCDGVGEYGYFAELAGTMPLRVSDQCMPAAGSSADILTPPLLETSYGMVSHRFILRGGYIFQMWLPYWTAGGLVPAVAEDLSGGKAAAPFPESHNGGRLWCCYAWPIKYSDTTRRAFFVNQSGEVFQTWGNPRYPFSGMSRWPLFDSAYMVPGTMGTPVRIGTADACGTIWLRLP